MTRIMHVLGIVFLAACLPSAAADAFDRLKSLEGTWKGKAAGEEAEVRYQVTSAGSAVDRMVRAMLETPPARPSRGSGS